MIKNPSLLQVGGLISGAVDIAYRDIRTSEADKKKAESHVKEVEAELTELKKSFEEKETGLKSEIAWAEKAEERVANLEAENERLKKDLEGRREEKVVMKSSNSLGNMTKPWLMLLLLRFKGAG